MSCLSDNTQAVDQSRFWSDKSLHWDAHRIGWAIAGGCAVLVRAYLLQLKKSRRFTFLISLLDCHNLCYIRSSTLSVRHGITTSNALQIHVYPSNYTNRAEQRQMYVP